MAGRIGLAPFLLMRQKHSGAYILNSYVYAEM